MNPELQIKPAEKEKQSWVTVNPCISCAPLGASLVFKGIEGGMAILHGSQGCATYIRRYLISHFREPVDIASSSFTEETVVFGGEVNLVKAVASVCKTYCPKILGIATTCLAETIGEDLNMLLQKIRKELNDESIELVPVHSPSYKESHVGGYDIAVAAVLDRIPQSHVTTNCIGIIPGMLSPQDVRNLKELARMYSVPLIVFPDYSETLDAGLWNSYQALPPGGTKKSDIAALSGTQKLVDWTACENGAANVFAKKHDVPYEHSLPPIGIKATDLFCNMLSSISGISMPPLLTQERARLLDSYVDGHKYVSGFKVAICCDEPLVRALTAFCVEIGLFPVLVATGRAQSGFAGYIKGICKETAIDVIVLPDADFDSFDATMENLAIDLCIGTSKLQRFAEKRNIPLVRVGFPIHDRFGASRIAHIGYNGAHELFDRIVNELIAARQTTVDEQWSYI